MLAPDGEGLTPHDADDGHDGAEPARATRRASGSEIPGSDEDEAALQRRDEAVVTIEASLARRLMTGGDTTFVSDRLLFTDGRLNHKVKTLPSTSPFGKLRLQREGALAGATPSQAFFMRCNRTTMSQADIDAGIVRVELGVAPLKPSEFVILSIGTQARSPRSS